MFHNSLIINGKKYSKIFCDIPNNSYLYILKLNIMPAKLDNKTYIKKAQKKWGTRFNYSKTNYINCDTDVEVGCPEHGFMFINADSHIYSKTGCFDCGMESRSTTNTHTFGEFLKEAHNIHKDEEGKPLYEYDEKSFKGKSKKINFYCKKHKVWHNTQTGSAHVVQGQGCPKCGKERTGEFHRFTKEKFIKKANEVFIPNNTDYTKLDLNNLTQDKKGIFICENGHEYEQVIYSHLQGIGCAKCSGVKKRTIDEFINESKKIYGDNSLDYSQVEYVNSSTKVKLICNKHKIPFTVTPNTHISQNCSCQLCSGKGINAELLINFLEGRQDLINSSEPIELLIYLNSNGWFKKINKIGELEALRLTEPFSPERQEVIERIKEKADKLDGDENDTNNVNGDDFNDNLENRNEEFLDFDIKSGERVEEQRNVLTQEQIIKQISNIDLIVESYDDESIKALIEFNKNKIWNRIINENDDIDFYLNKDSNDDNKSNLVYKLFKEEYQKVSNLLIPDGWSKKDRLGNISQPKLEQKWFVHRLMTQQNFMNLSDMGSGKTIALILAKKVLHLKQTIIVCPSAVVSTWANEFLSTYPEINVFTGSNIDDDLLTNGFNLKSYTHVKKLQNFKFPKSQSVLIINKDKFSQNYSKEMVEQLVINNDINLICYDELQDIKLRYKNKEQSGRREIVNYFLHLSREKNKDIYVAGLSGTPIVNNLVEGVSLLEMVLGKSFSHLKTATTITNAIELWKMFQIHGMRSKPKLDIKVNQNFIKINGDHHIEILNTFPIESNGKKFEELFLLDKLNGCLPKIKKWVKEGDSFVIFNPFVGSVTEITEKFCRDNKISYGIYNGEDKSGLNKFKRKEITCLICSKPVTTGVDGLQFITNKIITTGIPYTYSELQQLIKRFLRYGSIFDTVEILIPQIIINRGKELGEWSYDRRCYNNYVVYKGTLTDLAVDGIIPKNIIKDMNYLRKQSMVELKSWIDRLKNGDIITYETENLKIPIPSNIYEKLQRKLGDFSEMNKTWNKSNSSTTHKRLKESPEEWYMYHTLYGEARLNWNRIPYIDIANKIKRISKSTNIVGDFGCGENLLKNEISNQVLSFDHVAIDETVKSCDISNIPLDDSSLDVVVLSLAMMHLNCEDYIKEAYRTLRFGGFIHIAEPQHRWEGKIDELKLILENIGFKVYDSEITENFIYIDGIKS
jgi:superfamily II DNA or RNA helicase